MTERATDRNRGAKRPARRLAGSSHPVDLLHTAHLTLVGELAAGLAHEIKNPLAGIKGTVDILLLRDGLDEGQRAALDGILAQVARIDATVTRLMDHATPRQPSTTTVSLADLVDESLALARDFVLRPAKRPGRRLDLKVDVPDEPIFVRADPQLIETAVLNLVKNAAEAIDGSGRITVRIGRADDSSAFVEVSDTGPGLDEAEQRRLFHAFYTTKPNGTGLGLPAVQRIARAHGGRVTVSSVPGKGTTFRLDLPARRAFA